MNQQLEYDLKEIMKADLPESALINETLTKTYQQLNQPKKHVRSKGIALKAAISIAACLLLVVIFGVKNPTLAAQLPLIGRIFAQLEQKVTYPGDYSEHAVELQTSQTALPTQADTKETVSPYCKESGNLTITLSEVTYDRNAIYLAVLIQNKNPFSENAMFDDCLHFTCSGSMNRVDGTKEYFSEANGDLPAYEIEGTFIDSQTFQGLIQFHWNNISEYASCNLTFDTIEQILTTGTSVMGELGDSGEFAEHMEFDWDIYEGNWSFEIPIDSSLITQNETLVNDCNEAGFGIEKIVVTDYALSAVAIYPEGENEIDYIVSVWDANGLPLDSHGHDFTSFSTQGRDVSQITVFILDYYDYMDCKAENYKKQPEKAIYQKTIQLK